MTKREDIQKILVIGSGPIVIGQAAEFDYAGTQACIALKEEGYEVVLVNSNPATIMTDTNIADQVYIEPMNLEFMTKILHKEQPDAILPSLGGQTGLNIAIELADSGILEDLQIELLGTKLEAIKHAEDRELFRQLMKKIGEPTPESAIVHTAEEAVAFSEKIGFPIIVRPAFTLGGSGGGICHNLDQLITVVQNGLNLSPTHQCLVEVSIAGYKEIEYEVMRDKKGQTLMVCSMENFDPVGVHTGDSIVFAPTLSLSDQEEKLLSNVALSIIDALGIEGGCNVQLALNQHTMEYYVIEVNPRVSRSSALASKATGFPIARVSTKIAVGLTFDEMYNPQTDRMFNQYDASEIDYIVCKIPRFASDKFKDSDHLLGTQMKATGEAMAIGTSIEEALLKAIQSLEIKANHIWLEKAQQASQETLEDALQHPTDIRIFYLAEALRRDYPIDQLFQLTQIAPLFLEAVDHIIKLETELQQAPKSLSLKIKAKQAGFSDLAIAKLQNKTEQEVYQGRISEGITSNYQPVPIWSHNQSGALPYYYSSYATDNDNTKLAENSILVIGSGPIRIGQGVEFDYATVHCVKALQKANYKAIIVNSNPETVSTDFSIADKLYFEPLTLESVLSVIELEKPLGVIIQFGGQTSLNLAEGLNQAGVKILGTSVEDMNRAEDRHDFDLALADANIPHPAGLTTYTTEEALKIPEKIGGYPVLVRPSYVLGGRGMEVVENAQELAVYMEEAVQEADLDHPILIDHYVNGMEVEVDAICDGVDVLIPGIMEHIERAGTHSGDSLAVYPPQKLSPEATARIIDYTIKLADTLNCVGMMNIQFVVDELDQVYVIEVNPRASRTVPFLSKATDIQMAQVATHVMVGHTLKELGYASGLYEEPDAIYVKAPVFSFAKLNGLDPVLSPEMKSTGEVMGTDYTYEKALYKAFLASNTQIPSQGKVIITMEETDVVESLPALKQLVLAGYDLVTDMVTDQVLSENKVPSTALNLTGMALEKALIEHMDNNEIIMVVNTWKNTKERGYALRTSAITYGIPLFTKVDTFNAFVQANVSTHFSIQPLVAQ